MKKTAAVLLFMISTNASAWCDNQSQIGEVPYKINSSYFGQSSAKQLDKIVESSLQQASKAGYLMLEYQLDETELNNIADPKAKQERKHYNRWLADRRIKRVKDYLQEKQVSQPILTRLRTTAKETQRNVVIHLCDTSTDNLAFKPLAE